LVRDEIRRLDHILEDFLQFARPTQYTPKPVDLEALLQRVKALYATDAENRGIRLESKWGKLPRIQGDEGRLQQVLVNLTLNALDATPRGGRVGLSCVLDSDAIVVHVQDSGPGIAPDLRDRIFEPFFTTKAAGSGLGLPIVHAIITQHGGSITVENAPEGGARFVIRLPA
jgi:signal transduction histidine kinase